MRRIEIKSVASDLFAKKGYHDTSMQEIADTIGINKAALYFYFKSKADLYLEIVEDIRQPLIDEVKNVVENFIDSPFEVIFRTIFYEFVKKLSYNQILLWKRTILMSTLNFDEEIQSSSRELIKRRDEELVKIVKEVIIEKKPKIEKDNLNVFIISYSLFVRSFMDWMLLNHVANHKKDNLEMAEKLWNVFWNGCMIE